MIEVKALQMGFFIPILLPVVILVYSYFNVQDHLMDSFGVKLKQIFIFE
jgi:hypothetical protein